MSYIKEANHFRKDLYRTIGLIWQAGKYLSVLNVLLLFLQALLPVASLYIIKMLVDLISEPQRRGFETIYPIILWFAGVQFLLAVANQVSIYIYTIQLQRLSMHLSEKVLQKAVAVDMAYYENPEYHDTLHMAQQKSEYQAPVLLNNMNGLVLNSLSLLMLIGFLFKLQWFYALLFVAISIPLACVKWYYGYRLFKLEKKYVPMEREANYYHQVLTGVSYAKEVRSFGFADVFIGRYKSFKEVIYKAKDGVNKRFTLLSLLAQVIEVVIMAAILVVLTKNAWMGAITLGVFVIYLQGFQRLQTASKNFLQSLVQLFQQRLFLKDIFTFFDIEEKRRGADRAYPAEARKGLVVEDVSFTYPQTNKQVLKNVSIACEPGKIIAIVGENGSGKSTLVKLLARAYELQKGSIQIDGVNIGDIEEAQYRSNSIILFQDFEKYFMTIGENITLADELRVRGENMRSAAAAAGAANFISMLTDQYETRLGRTFQRSEQLSGGQWQKLALARTFYKKAKLIILDEPTSSIDAVAEHEIFGQLKEHAADKMVILISHRMYNLKLASMIYVMKDGAVAECGSYEELINKRGIFREMYNNQRL